MESLVQIGLSNAVVALVLAALAAVVGATVRKPALTHTLWLLVLLKLVTPPLVVVPVGWSAPAKVPEVVAVVRELPADEGIPEPADAPVFLLVQGDEPLPADVIVPAPEPITEPTPASGPSWWELVAYLWLTGACLWFGLALCRVLAFQRLLRFARPAPAWLREQVAALCEKLGLKQAPPIYLVPGRVPPMIWTTLFGPRLLLPAGLWEGLSLARRETLLVHELAHVRRRDHWVRGLELLVLGLYWWHPIIWIACRQMREAEEQCCDAWVVSTLQGSGRTYAEAILETLDFLAEAPTPTPLLASGVGPVADLKRRLTMIMRGTTPRAMTWRGLVAVLLVAGLLLPALPVWAQQGDKDSAAALKELREKLAELEKKLGRPAEAPRVDADALKKAEAELAEAQAALKKKAAEMEDLAKKVADATAKVVKAGGKPKGDNVFFLRKFEGGGDGQARVIEIQGIPGRPAVPGIPGGRIIEVPGAPGQPGQRIHVEVRPPNVAPNPNPNPRPGPNQPQPGGDRRIENLEQKLDRLMHELQEMRRSLPRPGGPGGPGPGGPSGPGRPGADGRPVEFEFRLADPNRLFTPATPGKPMPPRPPAKP